MQQASGSLVRFDRVSKRFGARVALDALSFSVERGEVVALLGPNGAGKSTTFGLMLGHLAPSAGTVSLHGWSVMRARRRALARTGAVPESPALYDYLTGFENLCCLARYSGPVDYAAVHEAIAFVGLGGRIDDRVRTYSRGMRQRLALAQALVPAPDLVLLDEPAEGLDPEAIAAIHDLVLRLKRERGITVVIASHLLAEAEVVADRVMVLDAGRLVFAGVVGDRERRRLRLDLDDWGRAQPALRAAGATPIGGDLVELGSGADPSDLVAALVADGVRVRAVEPLRRSLAELYRDVIASARGRS